MGQEVVRAVDPAEELVRDHRLEQGELGDLFERRAEVADQLLADEEHDRERRGSRGSKRDQQVAEREQREPEENRRPDADPPAGPRRDQRADERADPANRRDQADRRRLQAETLGREDKVDGAEGAPEEVGARPGEDDGPEDRETGRSVAGRPRSRRRSACVRARAAGRRLRLADRAEDDGRDHERDRVDRDRDRGRQDLDEHAADAEGARPPRRSRSRSAPSSPTRAGRDRRPSGR